MFVELWYFANLAIFRGKQMYDFICIIHTLYKLGDNCIQNVNLGRYIVGYMVGNFVSGAVKRDFRPYNR